PPRRAQNPEPTPGWPQSAPPAACPRVRNASASFAGSPTPPPDTRDGVFCGSPVLRFVAAARAVVDIRSAASLAPAPPAASATARPSAAIGNDTSSPPPPSARKPGAHLPRIPPAASSRPPAGLRAPSVFCDHRLQHLFVQAQIHHQFLQLCVLIAQLLGFLRFVHIHAAVLRFPGVDRVLRHAHFPRHVFRFTTRLQLLQSSDHLRFRVLAPRHSRFPFRSLKSYSALFGKRGSGQCFQYQIKLPHSILSNDTHTLTSLERC